MTTNKTPATLATAKHGGCVQLGTPGSRWAASGEPDPHGTRYDCERAALVMGDLTDDELANAVFMHGNERQTMADLVGGATPAIGYLTAAKDRIRWLSRALAAAESLSAQPSPGGQGEAHIPLATPGKGEWSQGWNACRDAMLRGEGEALAARQPETDEQYADEQALIDHLDSLMDDGGQGGEKWEPAQAAIAGIIAARQPVGELTDTEIDARLNTLYRALVASGQHNGGMSGVAWDRAVFRMASGQPAQAVDLGTGVKAIAAERERQLQAEGFTRDSDRQYQRGELAKAATAYVQLAAMDLAAGGTRDHIAWHGPAAVWPWAPEWWKPVDARRDLVRAGALIAAQIDLIDSQAVGK